MKELIEALKKARHVGCLTGAGVSTLCGIPDFRGPQGLPEEMVGKATERMSRINEAWAVIKEARGI